MKDDFMNKLKTILSGSSQTKEKDVEGKLTNDDLVNNFMNQILDSAWVEEDLKATCAPSYFLSKKNKSYWLMNTTVKSLFNVKGGIEVIPIEPGETNTLCLIGHSTYSIPNKYIVCPGWN